LLARLRFVWESMFRAYFAEHYAMGPCTKWDTPGPSGDDKLAWLDAHGHQLNWDTCVEPILRAVFPLADREQEGSGQLLVEPTARQLLVRVVWTEMQPLKPCGASLSCCAP
jgi:hypothetical protein